MATYQYQDIVDELISKGIVIKDEIYRYEGLRLETLYTGLFQFCQENLLERWPNYPDFQGARFYFTDYSAVDAFASPPNLNQGYYLLGISYGIVERLYGFFCSNDLIDDPRLSNYHNFNKLLEEQLQVSLGLLMAQTGVQYTFFHELGHFIQFSNRINGYHPNPMPLHDRFINRLDPYNENSHIREYDADMHGASVSVNHLYNFFLNSLSIDLQTKENFEKLLIAHLVGIFCYVMIIWGSWDTPIYYEESTHPHAIIRYMCISAIVIDIASKWFPSINQGQLLSEVHRVLNIYCTANGKPNYMNDYQRIVRQEAPNIMQYMRNILRKVETVPYLAVNTEHVK